MRPVKVNVNNDKLRGRIDAKAAANRIDAKPAGKRIDKPKPSPRERATSERQASDKLLEPNGSLSNNERQALCQT